MIDNYLFFSHDCKEKNIKASILCRLVLALLNTVHNNQYAGAECFHSKL